MIPDSPRKRQWVQVAEQEEEEGEERSRAGEFSVKKRPGSGKPGSSALNVELCLEELLPVEWRRCLDVQLGEEVLSHDARTKKSSCKDKGKEHEVITTSDPQNTASTVRRKVSLNLELNLQPCDEYLSAHEDEKTTSSTRQYPVIEVDPRRSLKKAEQRVEEGEEEEEMVATVCGRCHMLVILCVSRPCCPNCKFLHPKPEQTPFTLLFKQPPKCTTTAQLLC